jgi:hypothetical protein
MDFCTSIHCMDGRIQEALIRYLKAKTGAKYVDSITEPGPCGIVAQGDDETLIGTIRKRIEISLNHHGSKFIAISGHHDCAGNPVAKDVQLVQLAAAKVFLETEYPGVEVVKLWVDENWRVEEL